MPVTFQPITEAQTAAAKEALTKATVVSQTQLQAAASEYLELHRLLAASEMEKVIVRMEELRKMMVEEIASNTEKFPTGEQAVVECDEGIVVFSPAPNTTSIANMPGLIQLMGVDAFLSCAKVTITDAKKYVDPIKLATVTKSTAGTRRLSSAVPKSQ